MRSPGTFFVVSSTKQPVPPSIIIAPLSLGAAISRIEMYDENFRLGLKHYKEEGKICQLLTHAK